VSAKLLKAIAVAAELMGTELSEAAVRVLAADLARYPEEQVIRAIDRARRECRGRLTEHEIVSRIDDGRPGPEEAWAKLPRDEASTALWTDEAREAYGIAAPLLAEGDHIAARMAFLESYRAIVARARDEGRPCKWHVSLGHDKRGREAVIVDGVERRLISVRMARNLLPDGESIARLEHRAAALGLLEHDAPKALAQKAVGNG
jgi:hypothetical protein